MNISSARNTVVGNIDSQKRYSETKALESTIKIVNRDQLSFKSQKDALVISTFGYVDNLRESQAPSRKRSPPKLTNTRSSQIVKSNNYVSTVRISINEAAERLVDKYEPSLHELLISDVDINLDGARAGSNRDLRRGSKRRDTIIDIETIQSIAEIEDENDLSFNEKKESSIQFSEKEHSLGHKGDSLDHHASVEDQVSLDSVIDLDRRSEEPSLDPLAEYYDHIKLQSGSDSHPSEKFASSRKVIGNLSTDNILIEEEVPFDEHEQPSQYKIKLNNQTFMEFDDEENGEPGDGDDAGLISIHDYSFDERSTERGSRP